MALLHSRAWGELRNVVDLGRGEILLLLLLLLRLLVHASSSTATIAAVATASATAASISVVIEGMVISTGRPVLTSSVLQEENTVGLIRPLR